MDAPPITDHGFLKNFSIRDLFYAISLLVVIVAGYATTQASIVSIKETQAETRARVTLLEAKLDKIDHEGTIASKNGIYKESQTSKENIVRLANLEKSMGDGRVAIAEIGVTVKRLDANMDRLMQERGLSPK